LKIACPKKKFKTQPGISKKNCTLFFQAVFFIWTTAFSLRNFLQVLKVNLAPSFPKKIVCKAKNRFFGKIFLEKQHF